MGGAGKKLPGHGAHRKSNSPPAQPGDGGPGRPPHPLRLCPGQVFWSRTERKRRRPLIVLSVGTNGSVLARRLDGAGEQVRVSAARLLAQREDGQGRHYSFVKWSPRRYNTWAYVLTVEGERAALALPEWHPGREVRAPVRLLPRASREAGSWLRVSADLSQPSAGALNLSVIGACADPGDGVQHPPGVLSIAPAAHAVPELGVGCGDIVLENPPLEPDGNGRWMVFVREPPVGLGPGARVYLPDSGGGRLAGYAQVLEARLSPNGMVLHREGMIRALDCAIALEGQREAGHWRWRWWPRALEARADQTRLDCYRYDPDEHDPAYVWTHRRALVEQLDG